MRGHTILAAAAALCTMLATAEAATAQARALDRRGLTRTFSEEFDTLNVADPRDHATWTARNWKTWFSNGPDPFNMHNRTLPGNGENQVYTDAAWPDRAGAALPSPALSVQDGVLRIRADRVPPSWRTRTFSRPYTSGMIAGWGMFAQRYGVFEARIRLPKGRGLWPAFWMLNAVGGQPPEIDIMEFLGHDVRTTWVVAHYLRNGTHMSRNREVPHAVDMTKDFHVFAVDWRPQTITYFIDDVQVMQIPTPADMHRPMYVILNLAVGGRWGGLPDAQTVLPATMEVDWIRVWRRPEPAAPARKKNKSKAKAWRAI